MNGICDGEQCVAQRDARMRERGRIEQDQRQRPRRERGMDPADQVGLRVALERIELVTRRLARDRTSDSMSLSVVVP